MSKSKSTTTKPPEKEDPYLPQTQAPRASTREKERLQNAVFSNPTTPVPSCFVVVPNRHLARNFDRSMFVRQRLRGIPGLLPWTKWAGRFAEGAVVYHRCCQLIAQPLRLDSADSGHGAHEAEVLAPLPQTASSLARRSRIDIRLLNSRPRVVDQQADPHIGTMPRQKRFCWFRLCVYIAICPTTSLHLPFLGRCLR